LNRNEQFVASSYSIMARQILAVGLISMFGVGILCLTKHTCCCYYAVVTLRVYIIVVFSLSKVKAKADVHSFIFMVC